MALSSRFTLMLACTALLSAASVLQPGSGIAQGACDSGAVGGSCGCEQCQCSQCCLVQDVRVEKKWVYAVKLVPYCRTKCPNPLKCRHAACDTCPQCEECVQYKRVLIKREVVTKKPYCKCVPGCQACQAAAAAKGPVSAAAPELLSGVPAAPRDAIVSPAEPVPLPARAGPEPAALP